MRCPVCQCAGGGGGSDPVQDLLSSSLVMVGTRGRFYPLASSHTHTGLRDTVNTKLDGAFSFDIDDIL